MKSNRLLHKLLPVLWLLALPPAANAQGSEPPPPPGPPPDYVPPPRSGYVPPRPVQVQDYDCTISEGRVTITLYTGSGGDVAIPATILGLPVTEIGYRAFHRSVNLTSVAIPDSVRIIEPGAFWECSSLTSVTIPNSITRIKHSTFEDCTSLASVTIPRKVIEIDGSAFYGCSSLTSVTIAGSVTEIGESAFYGCSSLMAITVDATNPAYNSLDGVLFNKNQATLIRYPGGKAGAYVIPDGVTKIAYEAFLRCANLTGVTFPDGVTAIGGHAFASCSSLVSVTIPASVTEINGSAFHGCSSLISISVDTANPAYSSLDGVLFDKSQTTLIQYPGGKAGAYVIPGSVIEINYEAFQQCANLTGLTFPESITEIHEYGFLECTSLTSVSIPASVTRIGEYAFWGCTSLTSITIPASVTNMGGTWFWFGDPGSVFAGCSSLVAITVGADNPAYSSVDGVLFDKSQESLLGYPGGRTGEYTIPDSVTEIGYGAFHRCANLPSVTIPDSVTSIRSSAFESCTNLTSVYFEGNAPDNWSSAFTASDEVIVYYLPGTTGWDTTFDWLPTQALGRVSNLSTRGQVLSGDDILIGGFVIAGDGPRTMLLRGIGPALDAFLEPGSALSDPVMTLFSGETETLSNDDWSTQADPDAVAQLSETLGAFPLVSGSKDAALIADLYPGTYSVHLSGKNGTGIGLIELYDGSDGGNSRLVNISTRGRVGAGASIMAPGIVVTENVRRLLIRGVGPELAASLDLNPDDVLPDPILALIDQDGITVATNDDWSAGEDAEEVATVAERVGAFALTEGSADAAILIEVPAGVYTALVSDASGAEGIALVEVYTAP